MEPTDEKKIEEQLINNEYDWIIADPEDDEKITVKTKIGDFMMEEQLDEVIAACKRISNKSATSELDQLLAARCITGFTITKDKYKETFGEKITDKNFGKLPGSVSTRLKFASAKLHGMLDFLQ